MKATTKKFLLLWAAGLFSLAIPVITEWITHSDHFKLSHIVFTWYLLLPAGLIYKSITGSTPSIFALLVFSVLATVAETLLFRASLSQMIIFHLKITLNPQLFLYVFSLIALIIGAAAFFRKGPKLALSFFFVANLMSVTATTLFHQLVIQIPQDEENAYHGALVSRMAELPKQQISTTCALLRYECYFAQVENVDDLADELDLNNTGLRAIARDTANRPRVSHGWKVSSITESDINSNSYVIGYHQQAGNSLIVINKEPHSARKTSANNRFAWLTIAFHLFWVPGAIALAYRHQNQ